MNSSDRILVRLVGSLGVAQLLAWGVLYYSITVLGAPMAADLALGHEELFAAFTWALTLAGLLAPWAGKLVDRFGGRAVLVASAFLGALGFCVLARVHSRSGLFAGWSINGLAMALGLYETCFATLGQVTPRKYAQAVTSVTLIAGFSSTVTWPASHFLLQLLGWRELCDVYAVCLCVCSVIYLTALPRKQTSGAFVSATAETTVIPERLRRRAQLLAFTFAGMALIGSALSAHLLTVLSTARVSSEQAVWVASSIGALQVLGRLAHVKVGSRKSPYRLGLLTFSGFVAAVVILLLSPLTPWLLVPFALTYGVSNGLITIAKATVPVELLGVREVGQVLGTFSRPSLVARALGPLLFAMIMGALGTTSGLVAIGIISVASLVMYVLATRNLTPEFGTVGPGR